MKISKGTTLVAAAALTVGAVLSAPLAGADAPQATATQTTAIQTTPTQTTALGQQAKLVNGNVVQGWTISSLKPSTDVIPHNVHGTLWEATATDQAIEGTVIPMISNLNARARNGDTYRVLFGVATPQGVNPATLGQGQSTSGKIYFDVVGDDPDSVFYSDGEDELALWLQPAPVVTTPTSNRSSAPSQVTTPGVTEAATSTAAVPGSQGTPVPAGSQGTPLPSTTPAPAGSQGTATAEGVPVTPAPAASEGTPAAEATPTASATAAPAAAQDALAAESSLVPQGSSGTPAS